MTLHLILLMLSGTGIFSSSPDPTTMVHPPFGHCMGIYRAGTEQLALLLGGLVRFDDPQGLACVKLDAWDDPDRTGDDDELAVYGVNSGTSQIIYNADMYTLGLYGGSGSGEDELLHPHGIAADPTGLVLVADTGNERVVILRRSGSRLVPDGVLHGDFQEPWGVALDGAGRVYVTDREAGTLSIYDSTTDTLPDCIALDRPTGVDAVYRDRWFHTEESFIVAVTGGGTALVKLEGDSVTAEIHPSDCGGAVFNYPVIDFYGNVWVTDSISCMVHKFDGGLRHLSSFGGPGTGDLEFDGPTGIAVWRRFGQFFIAEREGARYFWVGSDLLNLDISVTGRELTVTGMLTENSTVLAFVENADGERVATLGEGRFPAGELNLSWTGGTASRSAPAPAGEYRLVIEVEPTYSSKGYFSKSWEQEFTLAPPSDEPQASSGEPFTGRGSN
jgi:hypothetical protein